MEKVFCFRAGLLLAFMKNRLKANVSQLSQQGLQPPLASFFVVSKLLKMHLGVFLKPNVNS